MIKKWMGMIAGSWLWFSGCLGHFEGGGREGGKVFLALGICLAVVFLVFYIVVKGREKD